MSGFKAMVVGLIAILSTSADAEEASSGKGAAPGSVGGKIEALGNKMRRGADKAIGATTRALKHAGNKSAKGLDKAGNKSSQVIQKTTGK